MKITPIVIAAVVASTVWAGETERRVTVCIESGSNAATVNGARSLASKMFAEIGVAIDWRGDRNCPGGAILVNLSQDTPENLLPKAWAYARPFEGIHVIVFYDRLEQRVGPARVPCLLAHVLVHEIGHMLQGVDHHSATGIMKARYDPGDEFDMRRKPLTFTPKDVEMIYHGLDARASRQAAKIAAQ